MTEPPRPTQWRELRGRERGRLLLFAAVPAVLLVALLEFLSWLAIARDFEVVEPPGTDRRQYVFTVGHFPWSVSSRVAINSLGFPDVEFAEVTEDECFRLLFVGDSYTFGDGVDDHESFVAVLRARLAARAKSPCVRVYNAGERASSIEQQLRNFRVVQPLLRPHAVVLAQYQNDLTDLTKTWFASQAGRDTAVTGATWRPSFRVESSLLRWLSYRLIAAASMAGVKYDLLSRWSILSGSAPQARVEAILGIYTTVFDSLVKEVREAGADFATVVLPSKLDVLAGRSPEEPFFVSLAQSRQVPALPLFSAFDSVRRPYPYLLYDGHLNPSGNALVASAIELWFLDSVAAPFAELRTALAPD